MKVTYIDHMGTDLSVVNAARVSFGKRVDTFDEKRDTSLIHFLARGCTSGDWESLMETLAYKAHEDEWFEVVQHIRRMPTHWTPFGHTAITLHVKVPLFVARQLEKHQVGLVISPIKNEVSRRYVDDEPEFYVPDVWRKRADNVKQGSSDEKWENDIDLTSMYNYVKNSYNSLIKLGLAPEQARMILPQSMYTEWYWTGNLYSFANVFIQRTDSHAQKETQEVAKQIGDIIKPLFPVSWEALTG